MNFFAPPSLDEKSAVVRVGADCSSRIGFFTYVLENCTDLKTQLVVTLHQDAHVHACRLYMIRATAETADAPDTTAQVEQLRQQLIVLHPALPGSHALVWICFVGCAESVRDDHRMFFYERLRDMWLTTRYDNIKVAMETLQELRNGPKHIKWTTQLPRISKTIIM